jgi:hypothetical protein
MWHNDQQKEEIFENICQRVINEKMSFNKAVEESPISLVTFYVWLKANIELEKSYNYAREIRADVLFEEIIDIADTTEDGVITTEKATGIEVRTGDMEGHRRLKIDARKWVVSKMLPKKYGEKQGRVIK